MVRPTRVNLLAVILLLLATIRCSSKNEQDTPTPAQAQPVPPPSQSNALVPPSPTPVPVNNSLILPPTTQQVNRWRIFDPGFNFLNTINPSSFPYLQSTSPIVNDSQISFVAQDDMFTAKSWVLSQATRSVRVQSFHFLGDEVGWYLANQLLQLKARGLDVRVIVDEIGCYTLSSQKLLFTLQQNGIPVEGFAPFYLGTMLEERNPFSPDSAIDNVNKRFHEKMIIIDAEDPTHAMAVIGGANISNHYYRFIPEDPKQMWTDQDMIVRGSIASVMGTRFDANFEMYEQNKSIPKGGLKAFFENLAIKLQSKNIHFDSSNTNPQLMARLQFMASHPPKMNWQPATMRFLHHRPRLGEYYITDAYLDLINEAQREVIIANAFFIPSPMMIEALQNAALRGVRVRILTNSLTSVVFAPLAHASHTTYQRLLGINGVAAVHGGGIEIAEWQGDKGIHNGEGMLHEKYAIFDREVVLIGSYNLEDRSAELDSESVLLAFNPAFAQSFGAYYDYQVSPWLSKYVDFQTAMSFDQSTSWIQNYIKKISIDLIPLL